MSGLNLIQPFQGAIVIADALGTKERWIKESQREYIEKYKEILTDLRDIFNRMNQDEIKSGLIHNPSLITVSDTVIAIFRGDQNDALYNAALWSTYFVTTGINHKIYFRGAISYGEIIFDEEDKILMGTAVDEVGEWHDKGQIVGIYTSPSAGFYDYSKFRFDSNDSVLVKHPVRLKNSYEYDCWLTNWPSFIRNTHRDLTLMDPNTPTLESYLERKFQNTYRVNDFNKIQYSLKFFRCQN